MKKTFFLILVALFTFSNSNAQGVNGFIQVGCYQKIDLNIDHEADPDQIFDVLVTPGAGFSLIYQFPTNTAPKPWDVYYYDDITGNLVMAAWPGANSLDNYSIGSIIEIWTSDIDPNFPIEPERLFQLRLKGIESFNVSATVGDNQGCNSVNEGIDVNVSSPFQGLCGFSYKITNPSTGHFTTSLDGTFPPTSLWDNAYLNDPQTGFCESFPWWEYGCMTYDIEVSLMPCGGANPNCQPFVLPNTVEVEVCCEDCDTGLTQDDGPYDHDNPPVDPKSQVFQQNVALETVSIYPNPTKGDLIINWGVDNGVEEITLMTIDGSILKNIIVDKVNEISFDMSEFENGVYLVSLKNKHGEIDTKKVLVKK